MRGRWKIVLVGVVLVVLVGAFALLRPDGDSAGAGSTEVAEFRLEVGAEGPEQAERWEVERGQRVEITVVLGYESLVHLHGYDVADATGPGMSPAEIAFVADTPGRFDLEAHTGWTTLARLTVTD